MSRPTDEPGEPGQQAAASRPGGRSARVRAAVFEAATELLRGPDWSRITMARIAERAGVNSTTVYRRWGSLENLVGDLADATVSERAPLPDTGTLAGDIRAHSQILVNDLTGENRRFLLRALIIAGNGAGDDSGQRALLERTGGARIMFERAAARGEPTVDVVSYFEGVVGPLYGWALLVPSLVRRRAPALVENFLADLENCRPEPPDESTSS
ncbi:TetR/AcrR family transcriptional regulator [Streptomyces sp. NPDC090493]|uniref:TetR/AcrR family transcriptional regulator n=1 Tax=Streptomyces sp. NPDC090493 TaxID=3365964 RepID=UPI003801B3C0